MNLLMHGIMEATGWLPAYLFSSGESGAWFYANDLTLLYKDGAGTLHSTTTSNLPVSGINDTVGTALDKMLRNPLPVNLVINGTFDSGLTGWSALNGASLSVVSGRLVITSTSLAYAKGSQTVTDLPTGYYQVSATARKVSGNTGWFSAGVSNGYNSITLTDTDQYVNTIIFNNGNYISVSGQTHNLHVGDSVEIDDVVLIPLYGNHAVQPTKTKRPLLKQYSGGGRYYIYHDLVDDKLTIVNMPSATYTYGTASASGVTINTISHSGGDLDLPVINWTEMVIISRSLTTNETTSLNDYLSKKVPS